MAKGNGSKIHDKIVLHVTQHLKERFYQNIRARLEGFHAPPRLAGPASQGHMPDVTSLSRRKGLCIFEVDTPESLSEHQTDEKWTAFARHAADHGGRFWVVVPKGTGPSARGKLEALRLEAKVWEV
jgi:hypothetical protein